MAADGERSAARRQHGGMAVAAIAALLIVAPGLLTVSNAEPGDCGVPPALDRFLAAVRHATPPAARLLVAGNPPGTTFYRAAYQLYPRVVYTAFPTDFAHSAVAPPTTWSALRRLARHDGASYVLLWSLPLHAQGDILAHQGGGMLVTVTP